MVKYTGKPVKHCEICGRKLKVDSGWFPPTGIDPRIHRVECPKHPGVFLFVLGDVTVDRMQASYENF